MFREVRDDNRLRPQLPRAPPSMSTDVTARSPHTWGMLPSRAALPVIKVLTLKILPPHAGPGIRTCLGRLHRTRKPPVQPAAAHTAFRSRSRLSSSTASPRLPRASSATFLELWLPPCTPDSSLDLQELLGKHTKPRACSLNPRPSSHELRASQPRALTLD